ncbi:hypothetical protein MTO96_025833 [Rhipicephalus appendiculatus]
MVTPGWRLPAADAEKKAGQCLPAAKATSMVYAGGPSYKAAGKKLAERSVASHLPRLPNADHKIDIRPKEGLTLTKLSEPVIGGSSQSGCRHTMADRSGGGQDRRERQARNTDIQHDDAKKMLGLKVIKLDGKKYEVTTYMAAPESCGKGVARGLDLRLSERELELAFSHEGKSSLSWCAEDGQLHLGNHHPC